jgi:hypothetical protein
MPQISEARLAANRENAKKSTGPRTQEGKERSRQNALKHGMTAGVVIAEELREKAEERIKSWTASMRPQTEPEAWLVERAAVDAVRVDSAVRCERARMEARLRNDELYSRAEGMPEAAAAKLGTSLLLAHPGDVPGYLLRLRSSRAGCEWLLERWHDMRRRHQSQGPWRPREFFEAQRFTGMDYQGEIMPAKMARLCVDYMLSFPEGVEYSHTVAEAVRRQCWDLDAMVVADGEPGSPESIYAANRRLFEFIAEQVQELQERLLALLEVEALDDSLAAERVLVDLSPDGKLLHRYEAELVKRVHQSLDQLARIRKSTPAQESMPSESARPNLAHSTTPAQSSQPTEKPSRNEPKTPIAASPLVRSPRVPKAPRTFPNPTSDATLAISITPHTPPSPILAALADTPEARLRAVRDGLLHKLQASAPDLLAQLQRPEAFAGGMNS